MPTLKLNNYFCFTKKRNGGFTMQIKTNKILKILVIVTLSLITLSLFVRYREKIAITKPNNQDTGLDRISSQSKKQRWEEMEKEVDTWTDALGKGIDPGIKKTVIVLNLLGFVTQQSCEGHIDWGRPYPWVSITSEDKEIETLRNEIIKIVDDIKKKDDDLKKKYPNLSIREALFKEETQKLEEEYNEMYKKYHTAVDKSNKLSRLKVLPLNNLIANFYSSHSINPDRMLVLEVFGLDSFEIFSLGGNWQIVRNDNEKLKKLKEYQQEMQSFTDFLTDYYFAN